MDKQKISGLKYLFPVSGVRYSLSGQNLHEDVGPGGGAVLGSSAHDVIMSYCHVMSCHDVTCHVTCT